MFINRECIDFAKTYRNFCNEYKPKIPSGIHGVIEIRNMADRVITSHFHINSLEGAKDCLSYQVKQIRKKEFLVPFISIRNELLFSNINQRNTKYINVLVESLILNIIAYRSHLDEHHTNMSGIIFSDICAGFSLVIDWIDRDVSITEGNNNLISPLKSDEIKRLSNYIYQNKA